MSTKELSLINVLQELQEYLEDHEDTKDTPNGPRANWAMECNQKLTQLMQRHGVKL